MSTTPNPSPDAVSARGITKRFGKFTALDDVDLDLHEHKIYGLLGRNGSGKTTLMQIAAGQAYQSSGDVRVFGDAPHENASTLRNVCFINESQKYPEDYKVKHVLASARKLLPHWEEDLAAALLDDFTLPSNCKVKKLSRGMRSSLGVVVGLASRAPLTIFDEPYLGLDAVARQLFYQHLLSDYAEHPRTVLLSTHLIDEVSDLIEHVILLDQGRVVLDSDADELRASAVVVSGPTAGVDEFTAGKKLLQRESLGNQSRVTVQAGLSDSAQEAALLQGLQLEPLSLQQLIVRTTTAGKEQVR